MLLVFQCSNGSSPEAATAWFPACWSFTAAPQTQAPANETLSALQGM